MTSAVCRCRRARTAPTPGRGPGAATVRSPASGVPRRRWPIVTTALVVLVAVVIGGGYVFWRVSQEQYYVGADSNGQVVIYRGISQRIAGFSWSRPYQQTGIQLAQVPSNYQQTVKTTYSTGSLSQVRRRPRRTSDRRQHCRDAYTALSHWKTAEDKYNAEVAQAKKPKKPTAGIAKPGPAAGLAPACARRPRCSASRPVPCRRSPGPLDRGEPPGRGEVPVSSITAPSPAVDPTAPLIPVSRSRRRTELIMLVFAVRAGRRSPSPTWAYSLTGKLPSSLGDTWPPSSSSPARPPGRTQARPVGGPAAAAARGPAERPGHRDDLPAGRPQGSLLTAR